MDEDHRAEAERSLWSKAAWKKCTKCGGSKRRMFLESDAAIVQEFSRREKEAEGAPAPEASSRLERSTPVVLYPK